MLYKVDTGMPLQSSNRLKVLVKKTIRKVIKWYVDLIMNQQIEFNAHIVRTINEEQEILNILVTKNVTLENQIEKLQLKVQELEKRVGNE